MNILFGLLLAGIGALFVIKSEAFYSMFGSIGFAEKWIHSYGGSRMMYKLIGILLVFVGFVIVTNLHLGVMKWIAKNMFGAYMTEEQQETLEYEIID